MFRQLMPLFADNDVCLLMRGKLFRSCVRSCMLRGSETWPVKKGNQLTLQQMRMIRGMMCRVKVADRFTCNELRNRPGIDDIITMVQEIG